MGYAVLFWTLFVSAICAELYIYFISEIRETDLWWSNISTLEKEISYRTEQGLYYSYYKHLIESESFLKGIYSLRRDKLTEAPKSINVFRRMNIAPEILLAIFQRIFNISIPIDFYNQNTIRLQSCTAFSLSMVTWILTGNSLSPVPFAVLFFLNYREISRVDFALPLRENFALPFWWLRLMFVSLVIRSSHRLLPLSGIRILLIIALAFTTASFCTVWQFSQFILLIESVLLLVFYHFLLLRDDQCLVIASTGFVGLLCTCAAQAGNLFPFASPCAAVLLGTIIWIQLKRSYMQRLKNLSKMSHGFWMSICYKAFKSLKFIFKRSPFAFGSILTKCGLIGSIFALTRLVVPKEDASHIIPFVRQKLDMWPQWDFHSALYLCSGAFQFMNMSDYLTLQVRPQYGLLLAYVIGLLKLFPFRAIWIPSSIRRFCRTQIRRFTKSKKPPLRQQTDDAFQARLLMIHKSWHLALNILFGLLSWSTLRMKYLWAPHMLVIATYGVISVTGTTSNMLARFLFLIFGANLTSNSNKSLTNPLKSKQVKRTIASSHSADDDRILLHDQQSRRNTLGRSLAVLLIILFSLILGLKTFRILSYRLSELKEFHDPDTVNLMAWIKKETHPNAIFTGSMQLMAAVKLCTGRPIANHPHYEDARLRERTRKLYQIYGRKSWIDVYRILVRHSISYIILENSICFAKSTGCAEKDVVDLDNNEWPDLLSTPNAPNATQWIQPYYHLDEAKRKRIRFSSPGSVRFCNLLIHSFKSSTPHYSNLELRQIARHFNLVYQDSTFNVFKVNSAASI